MRVDGRTVDQIEWLLNELSFSLWVDDAWVAGLPSQPFRSSLAYGALTHTICKCASVCTVDGRGAVGFCVCLSVCLSGVRDACVCACAECASTYTTPHHSTLQRDSLLYLSISDMHVCVCVSVFLRAKCGGGYGAWVRVMDGDRGTNGWVVWLIMDGSLPRWMDGWLAGWRCLRVSACAPPTPAHV